MELVNKKDLIELLIKERGHCVEAKYKFKGQKKMIAEMCQEVIEYIMGEVNKMEVHYDK